MKKTSATTSITAAAALPVLPPANATPPFAALPPRPSRWLPSPGSTARAAARARGKALLVGLRRHRELGAVTT